MRLLKHVFYFIAFSFLATSCKSTSKITSSKKEKYPKETAYLAKCLVENASKNIGSPYKAGGIDKNGFDCSGLVYSTFKNFDIILPRRSIDMSKVGKTVYKEEIRKGDLIFFKTNGKNEINHVGLVVEVNATEAKFIHASSQLGVIISSTIEPYYNKSFVQANRLIE